MKELVDRMLQKDVLSLSRLITKVERGDIDVPEIISSIYPHLGEACCVGITGPPGAGKSTIVDQLTAILRQRGFTVGIIAADPTSPFTGGALLGDRIRMQRHYLDEGVFIRSMATRGSHGGLPRATNEVIKLLSAFGKNFILVETVGVGQTEIDIMRSVDTVVVVLVPEAGDSIQTMKAGLFEIADVFVVNKADHAGAGNLAAELKMTYQIHTGQTKQTSWQVPVVETIAVSNVGIEELYKQIEKHTQTLKESGDLSLRHQEQRRREFIEAAQRRFATKLLELIERNAELSHCMTMVEAGQIDPYTAADEVLRRWLLIKDSVN